MRATISPCRSVPSAPSRHDLALPIGAERLGGNDVRIVGGPISDADVGILANDVLEADGRARGRVKKPLALVGGGPLRSGDIILPPCCG